MTIIAYGQIPERWGSSSSRFPFISALIGLDFMMAATGFVAGPHADTPRAPRAGTITTARFFSWGSRHQRDRSATCLTNSFVSAALFFSIGGGGKIFISTVRLAVVYFVFRSAKTAFLDPYLVTLIVPVERSGRMYRPTRWCRTADLPTHSRG